MEQKQYFPLPLYAEQFDCLRQNQDRGLRLEAYVCLGSNTVTFHEGIAPLSYLDEQRAIYQDYPVSLVQVYAYLTEYCKKPLDDKAFSDLEAYLLGLKARKMRALLRLAYEFEVNLKVGPTSRRIYGHLKQIQDFLESHKALVNETVLAVQAGFFGAWGEWHTAKYFHSKKRMLWHIADAIPKELPLQVRREYLKQRVKAHPTANRIGFHDDYLVGIYHMWSTPNHRSFPAFSEASRYLLNDGEMPWGKDTSYQKGHIDGLDFLKGCALRHLSTLSATHNFLEDGKQFNMARWQGESLSGTQALDLGLPFTPTYFKNEDGRATDRSLFDYLVDHLGYQILVKEISFTENELSVTLQNNGFALPYGFSCLICHVLDENGSIKHYRFQDFHDQKLLDNTEAECKVSGNFAKAQKVGFSLTKETVSTVGGIRFANACEFIDSVNWFSLV